MEATIDLNDVVLFTRVVEHASFTAAAHALALPTSSVSRGVARLEATLGVRLLHRTTRRLRLTDAGRAYFERARDALSELDEAHALASDLGTEVRGTVRVTAPVDLGAHLLAPVVARFVAKHPRVRVVLSLTARTVDLVQEGFDLAVRAGKLADSTLVARKVGVSHLALWASAAYLKQRGKPKSLAELASHACVLFRSATGRATWRLEGPHGEESVDVAGPVSADDLTFVAEAVAHGAGIGAVPPFLAAATKGELVRVLPQHAMVASAIAVVSPPVRYEPACVALFREALAKELVLDPPHRAPKKRA